MKSLNTSKNVNRAIIPREEASGPWDLLNILSLTIGSIAVKKGDISLLEELRCEVSQVKS